MILDEYTSCNSNSFYDWDHNLCRSWIYLTPKLSETSSYKTYEISFDVAGESSENLKFDIEINSIEISEYSDNVFTYSKP